MKRLILFYAILFFSGVLLAKNQQNDQQASHQNLLVNRIQINGNQAISKSEILKTMFIKKSHWWKKRRFKPQLFQDDLQSIITLYNNRGFLDASIASWDTTHISQNRLNINITITEGERSRVGQISFQGNHVLPASQLRNILQIQEGEPFSFLQLSNSTWSIINKYADMGYLDARVDPRIEEKGQIVQVFYQIQEGHPVYVESVIIKGNKKTHSNIVRRELVIKPGDLLTQKEVVTSQQNLYETGLFNSVTISPQQDSVSGTHRPVIVNLVEARTGEVNFGLGYGSLDKIRFSTEVLQGNLLGTGQKIGFRTQFSFRQISVEGLYTVPYFILSRLKLDNTAYYRREIQINYTVNRLGLQTTLGRDIFENSRIFSTLQIENNKFASFQRSSVIDSTNDRIRSLGITFNRDTRQNLFNPSHGEFLSLSGLLAGQIFQGTDSYARFVEDYIKYIPINSTFHFVTKISLGKLLTIQRTSSIPIYERFFAGGDYSIRGYKDRSVGPKRNGQPIGGYSKIVMQNDLRFPSNKKLQGALFIDVGNVWGKEEPVRLSDMRAGVGIGILYSTPLGLIRLDYGWKIHRRPDESPGQINFTIGQTI